MTHAAAVRGQGCGSALPVNGRRRFSGTAESRVYSRI